MTNQQTRGPQTQVSQTQVLAIDGNSLGHRAWHALHRTQLSGAFVTHGMVNMIASAFAYGPFDSVVVAFDTRNNFRKDKFDGYKAGREKKDPQLYVQLEQAQEILQQAGAAVLIDDGFEADDLLATLVAQSQSQPFVCTVLSSDRDLTSLVDDQTRMLRPRQRMSDVKVYGPQDVVDEYGVTPDMYVQFAALRGDKSDGLDGVKGVGPKTAAKLLDEHGSIDGIYNALETCTPAKRRNLEAARDNVTRNIDLMTLVDDRPLPFDVPPTLDVAAMADVLRNNQLYAAAKNLEAAAERDPIPDREPEPPAEFQATGPLPAASDQYTDVQHTDADVTSESPAELQQQPSAADPKVVAAAGDADLDGEAEADEPQLTLL